MPVGFVAYIDKSGDTGIERVKPLHLFGAASEWLVLSCFLVRAEQDAKLPGWVREIIGHFRNHQRPDLHFADLLPVKKRIACQVVAGKPCRIFAVMSNKKNIQGYRNPNIDDNNKAWPYWFLSRIMLERVTEFCENLVPEGERGEITLRIIFSRRGGLRYADFVAYMRKLHRQSRAGTLVLGQGDLRWSLIDFDEIRVLDHSTRAGLQLADIGAGAFFQSESATDRRIAIRNTLDCFVRLSPRMRMETGWASGSRQCRCRTR